MKQVLIPAAFNPAASAVDFSNVVGFNPTRLLAIINASARQVVFDPTTNGLGLASVSGSVLTLQANISTQRSSDRVIAFYDDGQSPATAAAQPALSADGGALNHITNFPATQTIAGAVTANDGGAAVTGAIIPSGGSGVTGWLSAIWLKLAGTLNVSGSVNVASLPSLPAGSSSIGAVTQSGGWTVSVGNLPSTQNVSDLQSAPYAGAVAMTVGANYAAQRSLGVSCTVAGAVQIQFSDASTLILPVGVGWQTFPFAVTQIVAAGTTATATYFNLK